MDMVHKHAMIKSLDRRSHTFTAIASSKAVDRDGEVVLPRAFEGRLETFMKNPVITWAHDQRRPPVGKVTATRIDDDLFEFDGKFASAESQFAKEIENLYAGGFLNAFSVGFIPHTISDEPVTDGQTGRTFREVELLEISAVPVPSNRDALMKAVKLLEPSDTPLCLFCDAPLEKITEGAYTCTPCESHFTENDLKDVDRDLKAVVPFKEYPKADIGMAWDAAAARQRLIRFVGGPDKERMNFARFRAFFALWDPQNPTNLGGYKLPHHDIIGGKPVTVFRGVVAAVAVVNGSRGGVEASPQERRSAYTHLARHVKEFDLEPPPFQARDFTHGDAELAAMQEYHLAMAEAHGLKVDVQIKDSEGEELQHIADEIEGVSRTIDEKQKTLCHRP